MVGSGGPVGGAAEEGNGGGSLAVAEALGNEGDYAQAAAVGGGGARPYAHPDQHGGPVADRHQQRVALRARRRGGHPGEGGDVPEGAKRAQRQRGAGHRRVCARVEKVSSSAHPSALN